MKAMLFLFTGFTFSVIIATVTIAITVAVTIAIAVTVFLTSIAITVTLFGLETIDNDIERHIAALKILDDATESTLVGHTLTDDENIGIRVTHKQ